jgi:hypothetical protein
VGLLSLITEADARAAAPAIGSWPASQQTILLLASCTIADQYIGRNMALETATEYYDGAKSIYLNLKRWPVVSVTSVKLDWAGGYGQVPGTFGSDTALVQGTGYILDAARGILQLRQRSSGGDWFSRGYASPTITGQYGRGLVASYVPAQWGEQMGSVQVAYTAGYAECPQDIVVAVAQIMTYMARINDNGGLISQGVSYIDVSDQTEVKQAIVNLRGGIPELGTSRQILDNYRVPYTGNWIL